jgi:betaine-aldehyde dehydrogenase
VFVRRLPYKLLLCVAELLDDRAGDIIGLVSDEMGAPPSSVQMMQLMPAAATLRAYAAAVADYPWREYRDGAFGTVVPGEHKSVMFPLGYLHP